MNIIEKYEIYKKGLVARNTSMTMQKFFKTEPTMDQLLYISQMDKENTIIWGIGLITYLFLGILIGLGISLVLYMEMFL